ncbi:MAG: hypothetical protein JW827_06955 [Spirochaetes bacterium]|nr:hypothetical protein [Spirochaetota bacterium]
MQSKIIFLIIIFLFFVPLLQAQEWSWDNIKELKEDEELAILNKVPVENGTNMTLKDKNQHVFQITFSQPVNDLAARNILRLKDDFFDWTGLEIKELLFVVQTNAIEISVLPAEFICNGTNVTGNMPAGMLFTYTDLLQYSFRLTKDNLFIRIQGYFIDKARFCEQILDALNNPTAYIRKRDPEFFLAKLIQLQDDLDRLRREYTMLRWAVITLINDEKITEDTINQVVELKKNNPMMDISAIRDKLDEKGIELSKGEINVILTIYFNEYKD